MSLDAVIDSLLSPIADKVSGIIFSYVTINGVKVEFLIALLIFAAIYFTIRTGFIGIWGFIIASLVNILYVTLQHIYYAKKSLR